MPIFEYRCGRCGHEFEKLVTGTATTVTCPECRSRKVVKKFSVFGAKSGGKFIASSGGKGCSSCSSKRCSSCH